MWECPECGRKFKNKNQKHSCGSVPETTGEYILEQREEIRPYLIELNETVKNSLTDVREKISWRMPTYYNKDGIIIQFAAFKNHAGIYPGPEAIEVFADRLKDFKTSRGTVQLPYSMALPVDLIREISEWCLKNRN